MPPSVDILRERLSTRGSESEESLQTRIDKAENEIARHKEFDIVVLNDDFTIACQKQNKQS